jgi:2-phosphoglycerate kinase
MTDYLYSNLGVFIIENNGGYERSAHVHRCTSYIAHLKKNWAYKDKTNIAKLKNSIDVYDNNDYKEIITKIMSKTIDNN